MNANAQRPGAPAVCTCTRMVVATLAETLRCPGRWYQAPDGTWVHVLPARRKAAA